MSAVAALPYLYFALGEHCSGLDVLEQGAVTLFVMLLDSSDAAELGGKLGEAFLIRSLGEAFVHIGPLVVLAVGGGCEVLGGVADAVQLLEP